MKKIERPVKTVEDILNIIKDDAPRKEDKLDIESIYKKLKESEILFKNTVEDNTLFNIKQEVRISSRVDKKKIISYYNYRLLQSINGRKIYDEIISSSPQNICPYCTIKTVKTIDHFLPKSKYPVFAITPINLVPSCSDCNTDKKISFPTCESDQTFHPYFDNIESENWLNAILIKSDPISFQFEVIKPNTWDNVKNLRAINHFKAYNINHLFSTTANSELLSMKHMLKSLFLKDSTLLKNHLRETYNSCLIGLGPTYWKTLMYHELSTNSWFIEGCSGSNFFQ